MKSSVAFLRCGSVSAENRGDLISMPLTVTSPFGVDSTYEMSERSMPSSCAFENASRTLAGSSLSGAPVLSRKETMISVPPLKSVVQFMYSPCRALLMNKVATDALMRSTEMISQIRNFATNAKLFPGGSRKRNLCGWSALGSAMASSDREGVELTRLLVPSNGPVEEDAGDPDVGGERGEDADEQHHGAALDRPRAVLQQHPAGGGSGPLPVEDRAERTREPEVARAAHGLAEKQLVSHSLVEAGVA